VIDYASFLGGRFDDEGYAIATGPFNDAQQGFNVVVGGVAGTTFPVSLVAFQTTFQGGDYDGFAAKFVIPDPPPCE
jgi:hypothetical protein